MMFGLGARWAAGPGRQGEGLGHQRATRSIGCRRPTLAEAAFPAMRPPSGSADGARRHPQPIVDLLNREINAILIARDQGVVEKQDASPTR